MPAPLDPVPAAPEPAPVIDRVPESAFVAVRPARPAVVVRLRRGLPLRHALMLTLAAAVMAMGVVRAYHQPMHKAIMVLPPALQGAVVT